MDDTSTWRTVLVAGTGLLAALIAVIAIRTWQTDSRQLDTQPVELGVPDGAHERLAEALRFRTITKRDPTRLDSAAYKNLFAYLEDAFPEVHRSLDTTHVSGLSRLYRWQGRDPDLRPVVLMAHTDVVPIEDSSAWTHAPFRGHVDGEYVWGRGALDDKSSVVAILEALEVLLEGDVQPARTVYVALGHDEEVGGRRGGRIMARRIVDDHGAPGLVIDEGGAIAVDALPGLDDPVAVVGVAGKGYLSVELEARGPGGHSSMPPNRTSIEVLNEAVRRLLNEPMPARLSGVTGTMFDYLAPEVGFGMRTVLANRWLTGPVLRRILNRESSTRAAIRTTMVPTRLDAGVKDNVIPTSARAVLNFRILPSHSVEAVMQHVRSTIGDLAVDVEKGQASSPSSVSAIDDSTFRVLQRTIGQVTADSVVVTPFLVPGTTDSRYYADDSDYVYRFLPFTLTPADRERIHGTNERISLADYRTLVRFYMQVVRNADRLPIRSGRH